ncbi:hypothetical protein ACTWP6_04785 [Mycobacterium sp. 4D054]|uniref:hypothetical protein n=1 Tax=Mycobacterium sp. 4D054 TaxID=3457440 RepID=UPI003FD622C0
MTKRPSPLQRGDVESVDYADPPAKGTKPQYRTPKTDERVAIRLHGHPHTYIVRVTATKGAAPALAELTIKADDAGSDPVDYDALRSVPARRLAYSARQWISRGGGAFAMPDDQHDTFTQPDNADDRLVKLPDLIENAIMDGLPVRPTVAAQLGVGKRTLDRMISKARAEGLLDGIEIPRRPSPKQRDELTARHELESHR